MKFCIVSLKLLISLLLISQLSACLPVIKPDEAGEQVRLVFLKQEVDEKLVASFDSRCEFIAHVVGSEGHWYTYLFTTNEDLTLGAINDMRNKAARLGANIVVVHQNIHFATSVTFIGDAYQCQRDIQ